MINRPNRISIPLFFVLYLVIGSSVSPLPSLDTKVTKIAGHRIVRVYDPKNTGADFFASSQIFQDKSRRYWLGHAFGLNLYDVKHDSWQSFSRKTGELGGYEINQISQSGDGKLWFVSNGDLDRHVTCFDGKRWYRIDIGYSTRDLNKVTAMFPGRDGRVWFARGHELLAYDEGKWTLILSLPEIYGTVHASNPDSKRELAYQEQWDIDHSQFSITVGLQARKGDIWLGTYKGIFRLDAKKNGWITYSEEVTQGTVYRIYEDRIGRIWFVNELGSVFVYDKDTWISYNLLDHFQPDLANGATLDANQKPLKVRGVFQDKAGMVMFATGAGLVTFKESTNRWEIFTSKNSGLPDDSVTTIMEDNSRNIWIGTSNSIVVLEQ